MERLTQWIGEDEERQAIPRMDIRNNGHKKCCNKLAEYEDLEETGLLVKLPCKVGDTVYDIADGYLELCKITAFSYGVCKWYIEYPVTREGIVLYCVKPRIGTTGMIAASEIGNTLFLTREAAEEKLKELKQHD